MSGSAAAIHPEVQKVTWEREVCRLMDAASESAAEAPPDGPPPPLPGSSEHCGRPDAHFVGTSKQALLIHGYFQEMHVCSVLGFIKNGRETVTEASWPD